VTEAAAPLRGVWEMDVQPHEPVMRSVLHRKHAALGAVFERRGAWDVPGLYGSEELELATLNTMLGFADVSARGKLHLSGDVDAHVRSLTGAAVEPLQAATIISGGVLARLARDWAVALLPPSAEGDALRALEQHPAGSAMVTDVTSAFSGFLVAGPRLEDLLARTLSFDLHELKPGRCVTASWARIPAALVMRDLPEPAVEIYVGSDQGRYAWEVLQRLAGSPVGWRALESWGWK
jgi:glycine cleavage system aminomethyltransferase T